MAETRQKVQFEVARIKPRARLDLTLLEPRVHGIVRNTDAVFEWGGELLVALAGPAEGAAPAAGRLRSELKRRRVACDVRLVRKTPARSRKLQRAIEKIVEGEFRVRPRESPRSTREDEDDLRALAEKLRSQAWESELEIRRLKDENRTLKMTLEIERVRLSDTEKHSPKGKPWRKKPR